MPDRLDMRAIMADRRMSLAAKVAAWAIDDRMGTNGCSWPSLDTVATDGGMSRSAVHEGVRQLVLAGFLVKDGVQGKANTYRPTRPESRIQNPESVLPPVQNLYYTRPDSGPEPSRNLQVELRGARNRKAEIQPDMSEKFMALKEHIATKAVPKRLWDWLERGVECDRTNLVMDLTSWCLVAMGCRADMRTPERDLVECTAGILATAQPPDRARTLCYDAMTAAVDTARLTDPAEKFNAITAWDKRIRARTAAAAGSGR